MVGWRCYHGVDVWRKGRDAMVGRRAGRAFYFHQHSTAKTQQSVGSLGGKVAQWLSGMSLTGSHFTQQVQSHLSTLLCHLG